MLLTVVLVRDTGSQQDKYQLLSVCNCLNPFRIRPSIWVSLGLVRVDMCALNVQDWEGGLQVAILGAGLSGLSAALALLQASEGLHRIEVRTILLRC